MLRVFISCIGLALLFSSCVNYRYVNTFDSEDVVQVDDSLRFENDDLIISYDFSKARLDFTIYNRSDSAMFIDWERSDITLNGSVFAYNQKDYDFSEIKYVSFIGKPTYHPSILSPSDEEAYRYISPGKAMTLTGFKIPFKLLSSDVSEDRKEIKKNDIVKVRFERSETVLSIQNNIVYSLDQRPDSARNVRNNFWLAEAALMTKDGYKEFYRDRRADPNTYLLTERKVNGAAIAVSIGVPIFFLAILAAVIGDGGWSVF